MAQAPVPQGDKNKSIESKKCVTPEARLSFPALLEPSAYKGQDPKYSARLLFLKNIDLSKPANGQKISLKHAVLNAGNEKWGSRDKWPKNIRLPFRDGNDKPDIEGYADTIFITANSKKRPGVVGPSLQPILNAEDIYAGCYVRAEVIAFAYTKPTPGISFSLQNIQKIRDGESFSGRKDPTTVFDAVETVDSSADDPMSYASSDGLSDLGI